MFSDKLSDLDELVLRCRSEGAKGYIQEAVSSYKVGAYRVCIVAIWTAVVFDFFDKIRELNISGSAEAKQWVQKYEQELEKFNKGDKSAISQLLRFERDILSDARDKFNLVSHSEYMDLERLHEDRNRCAHPTFQQIETPYYPTAEQARYHIKNAVYNVLSKAPIQGKYALEALNQLIESEFFPQESKAVQKLLEESLLSRATESLLRAFVDNVFFAFFNEKNSLYKKEKAIVILKVLISMNRDIAFSRIAKNINKVIMYIDDNNFCLVLSVLSKVSLWSYITDGNKEKVKTFCKSCLKNIFISYFNDMDFSEDISLIRVERLKSLSVEDIVCIKDFEKIDVCINMSVSLFTTAGNWNSANNIYSSLIEPVFFSLSKEQIVEILEASKPGMSDLVDSFGFKNFVRDVLSNNLLTLEEVRICLQHCIDHPYYQNLLWNNDMDCTEELF